MCVAADLALGFEPLIDEEMEYEQSGNPVHEVVLEGEDQILLPDDVLMDESSYVLDVLNSVNKTFSNIILISISSI